MKYWTTSASKLRGRPWDPELIFNGRHPCEMDGCPCTVEYDDEPWCFTHSPDEGSAVPGYSYRAKHGSAS
jgi:hypothetical protein